MTETSRFGYWIRPDGRQIPLEEPQSHAHLILGELHGPAASVDPSSAAEQAVLDGWIALTIAPTGSSCGIRVRKGAITRRAARALHRIVRDAGLQEGEAYVDVVVAIGEVPGYRSGTGRAMTESILESTWDDEAYPDPAFAIAEVIEATSRLERGAALHGMGTAALAAGNLPDVERIVTEMWAMETLRLELRRMIYGWTDAGREAVRNGRPDLLIDILQAVRDEVLTTVARMEECVDRARRALMGIAEGTMAGIADERAADTVPDDGSAFLVLSERTAARKAAASRLQEMESWTVAAPQDLQAPMRRIATMLGGLSIMPISIREHVRRLESAVRGIEAGDAAALLRSMSYHLAHECGRSSVASVARHGIHDEARALRKILAARQESPVPSP